MYSCMMKETRLTNSSIKCISNINGGVMQKKSIELDNGKYVF